jgi:hypothetical protein
MLTVSTLALLALVAATRETSGRLCKEAEATVTTAQECCQRSKEQRKQSRLRRLLR